MSKNILRRPMVYRVLFVYYMPEEIWGAKMNQKKNLSSSLFSIDGYGGKIVHITPEWLLLKNLKKKPSTRFWPLLEDYERKKNFLAKLVIILFLKISSKDFP